MQKLGQKLKPVTRSWKQKQFKITSMKDSLVCREDKLTLPSFKNWELFQYNTRSK